MRSHSPPSNKTDKTNSPAKLTLMKYDPVVRQHVLFNESKLASGKKR